MLSLTGGPGGGQRTAREILGSKCGEMRVMMQYMFQTFNFRGEAKPFQDLLRSVAAEEIGTPSSSATPST